MSSSSKSVRSEDELGEKWDRCIADSILKTGTGLGIGLVFSLLLFKRRPWPIALGTGFGLGYAVSNCQHDFRRVPTVHFRPVKVKASLDVNTNGFDDPYHFGKWHRGLIPNLHRIVKFLKQSQLHRQQMVLVWVTHQCPAQPLRQLLTPPTPSHSNKY